MMRLLIAGGLIVAVVVSTAGGALAALPLSAVGVLHQYCADDEGAAHPGLLRVEQPVLTDELATFGGTGFVAQYIREELVPGDGKMVVRIKVRRLDGTVDLLGKIVARQGQVGQVVGAETFPVAVRQGETVVWRYRFSRFPALEADRCVLLIGALGDASLASE